MFKFGEGRSCHHWLRGLKPLLVSKLGGRWEKYNTKCTHSNNNLGEAVPYSHGYIKINVGALMGLVNGVSGFRFIARDDRGTLLQHEIYVVEDILDIEKQN
ncbi:hypothetical protein DM860_000428 [Cuscuta australis]|uniref:Uncharacterized protein n=1 Tax=Cuscuta australis TaxID=267555 RepID=A0A328CWW4_9ASTE|nr:hypothetical protein DM860_000428 [Cuscuta australis]